MKLKISIIIPCYNEESNLNRGVLNEVYTYLSKQTYKWEVIIANDASTDNSLKIIKQFVAKHKNFKIINLSHGGKPSAVLVGLKKARYPLVLFTDMDQSTPISQLSKLLPHFNNGFDVVIGSRGTTRKSFSAIRKLMTLVFLSSRRLFLLPKIRDTQCGFKAFKTDVVKKIFPKLSFFTQKRNKKGWTVSAYDVELLFMLQKQGYKIKEVPVVWVNEDTSTTKGDNLERFKKESIQMAKEILNVLVNNLKGKYN
ncbi:glycosyltransferase [Patescibacteria group bacterium]|nr:glycosyltransferase [Patescibacteria group bacterium]MCG2701944.1 glycosyltransferase [Candidatus Parcubacteria bacterium]MBU4265161.1 glycosyltransferase [Patescibacteria group bacterium]MBU4390725.1 glycosyltransferase [Patescibacteria group bacterium]MBU4397496.1 glycosyltransferase [Patescibacteria group bacterium]